MLVHTATPLIFTCADSEHEDTSPNVSMVKVFRFCRNVTWSVVSETPVNELSLRLRYFNLGMSKMFDGISVNVFPDKSLQKSS